MLNPALPYTYIEYDRLNYLNRIVYTYGTCTMYVYLYTIFLTNPTSTQTCLFLVKNIGVLYRTSLMNRSVAARDDFERKILQL